MPAILLFAIFVYRPLINTFILSFYEWNMIGEKVPIGLNNFIELMGNNTFKRALINSVYYALWLICLIIFLPTIITAGISSLPKKFGGFYRIALFTPTVVSLGIGSVMWLWIFNPIGGFLGNIWKYLGYTPINWLSGSRTALIAIVIIVAWKAFGYNLLLLMAGFGNIPKTVMDAARVDGAVGVKLWWYIILPLISPTTLFVLIFTLSMSSEYIFTPIHVLTVGGPRSATTNLVFEVWRQAFRWFRVGTSSALAILVLIIFSALTILVMVISNKVVSYEER